MRKLEEQDLNVVNHTAKQTRIPCKARLTAKGSISMSISRPAAGKRFIKELEESGYAVEKVSVTEFIITGHSEYVKEKTIVDKQLELEEREKALLVKRATIEQMKKNDEREKALAEAEAELDKEFNETVNTVSASAVAASQDTNKEESEA